MAAWPESGGRYGLADPTDGVPCPCPCSAVVAVQVSEEDVLRPGTSPPAMRRRLGGGVANVAPNVTTPHSQTMTVPPSSANPLSCRPAVRAERHAFFGEG